jgi:hypothetical protein
MYLVDILVLIWVLNSTIIFLVGYNIQIYFFINFIIMSLIPNTENYINSIKKAICLSIIFLLNELLLKSHNEMNITCELI